jgi:hypothetical protein
VRFTGDASQPGDYAALTYVVEKTKRVKSQTREITYDYGRGQLIVDSPRTQGFSGFPSGAPLTLSSVRIDLRNDYGLVLVQSLENKPLSESNRMLVTAVGNAINSGMETVPAGNRLKNPGHEPVLVEPMKGTVTVLQLKGDLSKLKVYALDASGTRVKPIPFSRENKNLVFEMKPEFQALNYEVVR